MHFYIFLFLLPDPLFCFIIFYPPRVSHTLYVCIVLLVRGNSWRVENSEIVLSINVYLNLDDYILYYTLMYLRILCTLFVKSTFYLFYTYLLVRAYCAYVRPLLEYNSVIWSPHLKCDIEDTERVQRLFTKLLPGYPNSYSEQLRLLQLPSLEIRRLQNDLIWCYKTVFGHTITYSDFFKCS